MHQVSGKAGGTDVELQEAGQRAAARARSSKVWPAVVLPERSHGAAAVWKRPSCPDAQNTRMCVRPSGFTTCPHHLGQDAGERPLQLQLSGSQSTCTVKNSSKIGSILEKQTMRMKNSLLQPVASAVQYHSPFFLALYTQHSTCAPYRQTQI